MKKTKLRICIVGNMITLPWSPDHAGVVQTLEKFKASGRIGDYLIADCHVHHSTGANIVDTIAAFGPDLILHGMTDSLSSQWPEKLRERMPNVTQVMSMWDYRPQTLNYDGLWDTWKKSGPFLDLITLSNKGQMEWWSNDFGVETIYWPHGCEVKDVEFDEQYVCDTVFTGDRHMSGPYQDRVRFIDEINRHVPITWVNKGGGDSDPERAKVWQDLGKIFHSAKTVLDISHFWSDPGYASGRYFYTAGLGGCSISKRFPDCEELFPEGTKIYFDTPEEAVDKIRFYVANEKERNEVKRKGKEWANKYHTYDVRFEELFKKLGI